MRENEALATPEQPTNQPPMRPQPAGAEGRTIIGKDVVITGDITGNGDVEIRGTLSGSILLKNHVATIARTGVAQATITAKNVEICGHVEGDVVAEELVIIRKDSTVTSNVKAKRVSLEDGAHFKGSVDMQATQASQPSKQRPTGPAGEARQGAGSKSQSPPQQPAAPRSAESTPSANS